MYGKLLRQLRSHLFGVLLLSHSIVAATATLIWLFLSIYADTSTEIAVLVVLGAALLVGLLLVYIVQTVIIEPIDIIQQAVINAVSNREATKMPQLNHAILGHSLVSKLTENIHDLVLLKDQPQESAHSVMEYVDAMLNKLPAAILVFDHEQKLAFANYQAQRLIGDSQQNIIGASYERLLDLDFKGDILYQKWLEGARENKVHDTRIWQRVVWTHKDGSQRYFDLAAYYSKQDSFDQETTLVLIDKTEIYKVDETQLNFVSIAAHELRGPITVIRGYLDALDEELSAKLDSEQFNLLTRVKISAAQLSTYVNNILNVSKLDQNALTLFVNEEDWKQIVNEAIEESTVRAKALNRQIVLNCPDSLPTVAVDKVSIIEVISNLLDNALKYSYEHGKIVVTVKLQGDQVETSVRDFGTGIPESVVNNLFKKFYRSHRTKGAVGGTGLGLYIAKAIVDAHGGQIYVRSKEGEGSTFGFLVPTYTSVADRLNRHNNQGIVRSSHGWIKNHAMYRK